MLGVSAVQTGEMEYGIALIEKAITVNPDIAAVYNNLGNSQKKLLQYDNAIVSYEKALSIRPDYADAHNNLGNTYLQLGRLS